MRYVVYCDESRHESEGGDRFMAIGGLWVPREKKYQLNIELRRRLESLGIRGEVKWSKTSAACLEAYRAAVNFFFEHDELEYRAIVVDHARVDVARYHGGDRELGFYKFYYEMLEKWLEHGNEYLILLDFKKNRGADRYAMLRRFLERKLLGKAWITDLTVIESKHSRLAQLADLLTGAVAASWCGIRPGSPKEKLAHHMAAGDSRRSLLVSDQSPTRKKLNIFKIWL